MHVCVIYDYKKFVNLLTEGIEKSNGKYGDV